MAPFDTQTDRPVDNQPLMEQPIGQEELTSHPEGSSGRERWRKLSPKTWGLIALGGLVLAGGGFWTMQHSQHSTRPGEESVVAGPPIAVTALQVEPRLTAQTLGLSGTIRPIQQATLSTRVMGRITNLSLEAGDRVQKGQVVARVNVTDIAAQTQQAQSGVIQSEAELARAQATVSQLESQRLEAQAALRLAQIEQKRMATLRAEGAVAQSQLDQANTNLDMAKARVAQAESGVQQAKAAIGRSQAAINQAQAAVTAASSNESYGTILAPFDGVVTQKLAYEGEMAAPGTPLLKVENPDRLELDISVPEERLKYVQVGQPVTVRVDAINRSIPSRIQQIIPSADPNSRSFLVKIPLQNTTSVISGMYGRLELPSRDMTPTVVVPASAIVRRGQLEGVYVVSSGGEPGQAIATLRWVKTGKVLDGQVEIPSGLSRGDRVITSNTAQLSDGQRVQLSP